MEQMEQHLELGLMATPLVWSSFYAPTGSSIWPLHSQCHNSLHYLVNGGNKVAALGNPI
jgi:hypothetical protein